MGDGGFSLPVIAAISIISRTNEPLYFKSFLPGADDALRLQLATFAALDVVEERLALRKGGGSGGRGASASGGPPPAAGGSSGSGDPFLGMLGPLEEHKVFGYATPTQVKLLLVVRDVLLREDRLRELFRALHRLYADAACNPFAPVDAPLAGSRSFEEGVGRALDAAAGAILYQGPLPV